MMIRRIEYTQKDKIFESLLKVEKWVESRDYKGYEPFDGLSSALRPLTFGNLFLDRILMQTIRQSPVNLRPLLGVKPLDSTIGRGYMAWGYLLLLKTTGDESYAAKAANCLQWLMENKSPRFEEYSWGKHFDFASRGGRYPKHEPITVWTSLIAMAFLDAYELLGERKHLDVVASVCRWILRLGRNEMDAGICLSYTGSGDGASTIHNHSVLAAAVLARTAKHIPSTEFLELAKEIMRFTCSCQLPHGGWYYGEDPMFRWIDNFHTGYVLDSLKYYMEATGDQEFETNLLSGLEFYKKSFFERSGRPKYYYDRVFPVDSQCASQAIDTLAGFADADPSALALSLRVADWMIDHMQDPEGYFYYRQYPLVKAKTPMLHWAQATMYKALALLQSKL
jgi:rhamnogalacturonyl hydrolase YesR